MSAETQTRQNKLAEKKDELLEPPPMYRVIMLNDDFTPMEFVVELLIRFFAINEELAVKIMLKIHNDGKAVCGVYPRDIAQTKIKAIACFVREHKHPLVCIMEEDK